MNKKTAALGILFYVTQLFVASSIVHAQSVPNPDDLRQASKFLSQLPAACKNSYMSIASDGTVTIHILCEGRDKSMEGSVTIKDGIVKNIR